MSVASGQYIPVVNKIALLLLHKDGSIGLPFALCLTPYADVRILGFGPFHKAVVIVALSVPHAVLDIPVEQPQAVSVSFGLCGKTNRECTDQNQYTHDARAVFLHAGNILPAPVELQVESVVVAVESGAPVASEGIVSL